VPWRWARISWQGRKYLGVYGRDEYSDVFHAVIDLEAIIEPIGHAAQMRGYQAFAIWRLGPHDVIVPDERLPPGVFALTCAPYENASPEQIVVLVLTPRELATYGLPEMR
jgi:hypothetical protein